MNYSAKIDVVIYQSATNGFTQRDWIALALAALDQAGISVVLQERIEAMLPAKEEESDDLVVTAADAFVRAPVVPGEATDEEREEVASAAKGPWVALSRDEAMAKVDRTALARYTAAILPGVSLTPEGLDRLARDVATAPVCPRCLDLHPGVPGGGPETPHPGPFTSTLCAACGAAS